MSKQADLPDDVVNFFEEPKTVVVKTEEKKPEEKKPEEKPIEEKKDDDVPDFLKEKKEEDDKKKKGKPPEENIAVLRKERDAHKEKLDRFTSVFGEVEPEAIKPIIDLLSERAEGPVTTEFVTGLIEEIKTKDEEIEKWKTSYSEHEKKLQHIDITTSQEFQDRFRKPYEDSAQALLVQFASVTDDKKILAPNATKKLHSFLMEDPENVDAITVKQKLKEFYKEFQDESGEEADTVAIKDIMSSVRDFASKKKSIRDAYTNWKTAKEEEQKKQTLERSQATEAQQKEARKTRVSESTKAFNEFEFDVDETIDKKALFVEEFQESEKFFNGEDIPPYSELMTRGVKARIFDKILPRYKELIEFEKTVKASEKQGLKFNAAGRAGSTQQKQEKDWLTGE